MTFHLRVRGGAPVPAGKIVAIGKNYEDHRKEMAGSMGSGAANDVRPPEDPVTFLKPATCLLHDGDVMRFPPGVANVHWETELAVVIGAQIRRASEADAMRAVLGYAVFLDMTARDLQAAAKKEGLPWTLSKGMDGFGPISEVVPASLAPAWDAMELELLVNGVQRQRAATKSMIHSVPKILSFVSRYMTLEPGDIVATGTPAGVGACKSGDVLDARLVGVTSVKVRVE